MKFRIIDAATPLLLLKDLKRGDKFRFAEETEAASMKCAHDLITHIALDTGFLSSGRRESPVVRLTAKDLEPYDE